MNGNVEHTQSNTKDSESTKKPHFTREQDALTRQWECLESHETSSNTLKEDSCYDGQEADQGIDGVDEKENF